MTFTRLHPTRLVALFLAIAILGIAAEGRSSNSMQPSKAMLEKGLEVWRKPGRIQGGAACATCHSPDGIELAYYNFDDANLLRRARPHLDEADCQVIVTYIHQLRQRYGFATPVDPILSPPLQPGGTVLAGETSAARDLAFGRELQSRLPAFFGPPIVTFEAATRAEKQLLTLDPRQLPIGVPFNRISEDIVHGNEHSTIAQWLPEVPPNLPSGQIDPWYRLEDDYLVDPSQDNLRKLIVKHSQMINPFGELGLAALSTLKYRALLVLQDRIRNRTLIPKSLIAEDVRGPGITNSIWQVGDLARQYHQQTPSGIGMDADTQAKKLAGPEMHNQLTNLRISWLYAGWLSDQGLFKTGIDDKTRLGLWLSEALFEGGYPIHNVYTMARRQAVISNDPESWAAPLNRKHRIWDFAALRIFHGDVVDVPKDPAGAAIFKQLVSNCYRMSMLLLKQDLETTGRVWIRVNTRDSVADMVSFIDRAEPGSAATTDALQSKLDQLIDSAVEAH